MGAFLAEVDASLRQPLELHVLGGFVLCVCYGLPRPTQDIDFIAVIPNDNAAELIRIAGRGSPLADKHRLCLDQVTIAELPDDYEDHLLDLPAPGLRLLKLRALSAHDLILAKLTRNSPKDLYDLRFLGDQGVLDPMLLESRYQQHLRPYLATTERHDLTLTLWLDALRETEHGRSVRAAVEGFHAKGAHGKRDRGDKER